MSKGFFNWTFSDVKKFLEEHGFIHGHTRGGHYYFVGNKGHIVQVPFHGSRVFKPRTIKGIIRQSGVSKEKWLDK